MKRALVIQTAFLGDVILTLPLVQVLKKSIPEVQIDFISIPGTVEILQSHPDITNVIVYDKHGSQKSPRAFLAFASALRKSKYDHVFCPHRSLRSCLLSRSTKAEVRVGFRNSALKKAFTNVVPWKFGVHEIERDLSLLGPLGIPIRREEPHLFPTATHRSTVDKFLSENGIAVPYLVIAPGTVWPTKQYPVEMMAEVARKMLAKFENIVIIGGEKDAPFVSAFDPHDKRIVSGVGKLSVMCSAELIRRAALLIANDSAPVHIASAFNIPTVAIFGPTVRDFGFYPYHERSVVVEVENLSCRPCTLHGGRRCPIGTFVCMKKIAPDMVVEKALALLEAADA